MASKAKEVSAAVETQEAEPRFTVERLQQNAYELFGVPTSTFVGATAGLEGLFTVEEIKARIESWSKEEAK